MSSGLASESQPFQPTMETSEQEPAAAVVNNVVRAIQNLTTDTNYKIVSDVFTEVSSLRDKNANLTIAYREALEDYRHYRNELDSHVQEKDRQINELSDAKSQLTEEKTALQSQVEQKDKEISDLTDTRARLEDEKANLESTVETKSKEIDELTETKSRLEGEKAELEAKLEEKGKEIDELTEAKLRLETDKSELESTVEGKMKEISELSEAKAQLESQKAELEATVEAKTKEIEELTETKSRLEGEKAELDSIVEAKDKEIQELQDAKAQLAKEKSSLESKLEEKGKELAELQEAKKAVEEEKAKLESKLEEKEKELQKLSEAKAKLETKHAKLKETKSKLEAELKETNEKLEKQRKEAEEAAVTAAAEIASLQKTIEEKEGELKCVRDELASLEAQLKNMTDRADAEKFRGDGLQGELDTMTAKANEAGARVDFLEMELKVVTGKAEEATETVKRLEMELQDKISRLTVLESYRVNLKAETEDEYVEILDTIWTHIAALVESQFRQDLDASVIADASCWAKIRGSEYLKQPRQIPLPQSNTAAAKQMRVAAVLAILSRSLHRHVFRPVYLIDEEASAATPTGHSPGHNSGHSNVVSNGDRDNLARLLHALGAENPVRESHFRATLLATLPERQRASAARRARTVAREVSWLVQDLLGAAQYEDFCAQLEAACTLACAQWMRIQRATTRIEAYFGPPYDDFDWQVLPLPHFDGIEGPREVVVRQDEHDDGAAIDDSEDVVVEVGRPISRDGGNGVGRAEPRYNRDREPEELDVEPSDIMLVVWPSMCTVERGQLESITQGLVISKDQVRSAQEEMRGRGRQRPSTKRARTLSMPGRGVSGSIGKSFVPSTDGSEPHDG